MALLRRGTFRRATIACVAFLGCAAGPAAPEGARAAGAPAPSVKPTAAPVATTHGLTIPAAHPRLWFGPERLPQAEAWHRRSSLHPRRDDRIGSLAKALLARDRGRCREAVAWALGASRAMRVDGAACDDCRWSGEAIVLAYDWCHDAMTPEERRTFVAETNRWIEHWRVQPWGGPKMPENNYFWGNVRNQLGWAITSYEENREVAEVLLDDVFETRLANAFYPAASSGPMKGGIGREGSQYGLYVNSYATIPLVTSWSLGRDLFAETEFWKEAAVALVYSVPPAPTTGAAPGQAKRMGFTMFPYSDDERWLNGSQLDRSAGDFMTAVAIRYGDAPLGQYARQWLEMTGTERSPHVLAIDPGGKKRPLSELPLDYWGAGAKFLYGRSAWSPAATAFFLQLGEGPGGGHAHVDWGTWQIWRGGRFLSRESVSYGEQIAGYGGAGTAPASLALAHNSLLVNGLGLRSEPWANPATVVRQLESRPSFVHVVVDLSPTARARRGNPDVEAVEREFVFLRKLETLVVLDRLRSRGTNDVKTFVAHCETEPVVGPRASTCLNGDQALVMTTLVPAAATHRVVREGGKVGQHRIEVDTRPGSEESYILTVLQAKPAAAANLSPSVTDQGGAFVVKLDAETSVTFQKGMAATKGALTEAGKTTPFLEGVQTVTVGNDGPAWK